MKVNIGPYVSSYSVYHLSGLLRHVGVSRDTADKVGDWLYDTWVGKFIGWLDSFRQRKMDVTIHNYDTWGMYDTLAVIIAPMLRQLKETKHGYPLVDDEDVPADIIVPEGKDRDEVRWDYVLGEMINSFDIIERQTIDGTDWTEKYYSGNPDFVTKEVIHNGETMWELERGPNYTFECDKEGLKKEGDRIQNGFRLFGKYFMNLWD